MAQIPLINAGQAQLVDTGIQVAQTARLEAGGGAAAWGQALQSVGEMGVKFVQQRQKANDANTMIELEGKMRQLTADQMKFQSEVNDQEQWGDAWNKRVTQFETDVLKKARLSPDAKMALAETFGRFSQGQSLSIQEQATSQAKRRLTLNVDNMMQREAQSANLQGIEQAGQIALAGGMLPEEVEAKKLDYQQVAVQQGQQLYRAQRAEAIRMDDWNSVKMLDDEAEGAGFIKPEQRETLNGEVVRGQVTSDLLKVADKDPRQALQMAKDSDLPRQDKDYLEREISNKLVTFQRGELARIGDQAATGAIKRGEDIQFEWITSPAERKEIIDSVNALPPTANELVGSMLDLRGEIADFDSYGFQSGDKESMMKYVDINARIAKLPAAQRDDVSKLWDKAKASQLSVKEKWVSTGEKIVNEYYKAQEVALFDKDGLGGRKLKKGKEKEYAELKLKVTRMENDLKKLMPEDPNDAQAMDVINQVTAGPIIQQRKSSYMPPPKVQSGFAPIPARGVEPAMPGGGGSVAFPILFPNITQ